MDDLERRLVTASIEIRTEGDDNTRRIAGYAALFHSQSEDLGGWREIILPAAFDDVIGDDVRALWNHDPSAVLGRTSSGTLRLTQDRRGLFYEVDLPDTQIGRDIMESIRRGDINQSSFAFTVAEDFWEPGGGGAPPVRKIYKFARLFDVGPVAYPAYPATSVSVRAIEKAKSLAAQSGDEVARRRAGRHANRRRKIELAKRRMK